MPRMTSLQTLMVVNLLIPGSGLVLRDRPWAGYSLILLTGFALSGAVVHTLLATEALAAWLGPTVLAMWLVAVLLAGGLWWMAEHAQPTDQAALPNGIGEQVSLISVVMALQHWRQRGQWCDMPLACRFLEAASTCSSYGWG